MISKPGDLLDMIRNGSGKYVHASEFDTASPASPVISNDHRDPHRVVNQPFCLCRPTLILILPFYFYFYFYYLLRRGDGCLALELTGTLPGALNPSLASSRMHECQFSKPGHPFVEPLLPRRPPFFW
ncbi:hypothetical protein GQ53DRAFT_296367 [Thozetella sp. PMI_491]|nr:hypothetical protein GQ53DRAFT_296367 [Thozetella sp. PMI_491]